MTGFPCPCCGYLTLSRASPGTFEVCPVCYWEDDDVQARDPEYSGGANAVSLNEARANYRELGASAPNFQANVRPPNREEFPR